MGEENRGSSGGGTAMVVIAILGGLLLLGCCGGVVVLAGGFFMARSTARDAVQQFELDLQEKELKKSAEEAKQVELDAKKAIEEFKAPGNLHNEVPADPVVLPAPAFPEEREK